MKTKDEHQIILGLLKLRPYDEPLREIADSLDVPYQRLAAILRRINSKAYRYRGVLLRVEYDSPQEAISWCQCSPGIKNPRTGLCGRIPATVTVRKMVRRV